MNKEIERLVDVAKIGGSGLVFPVDATAAECAALAVRMDVPGVLAMSCSFRLTREGDGVSITAHGSLRAQVMRMCIVSAEDFETDVAEDFVIRFVPEGTEREDLDPDEPDEVPYVNATLDLGEAAAEQLALALDPYPKMPGAVPPDVGDSGDASPFAVLARRAKER